jgi:hypothetical protein
VAPMRDAKAERTLAERTEDLLEEFGDLNVNVFTVARWATMHPSEPRGKDYRPLEPVWVVRLADVLTLLAARDAKRDQDAAFATYEVTA